MNIHMAEIFKFHAYEFLITVKEKTYKEAKNKQNKKQKKIPHKTLSQQCSFCIAREKGPRQQNQDLRHQRMGGGEPAHVFSA